MLEKYLINKKWQAILKDEFEKKYFHELEKKLKKEYKNYIIYPKMSLIFNIFNICPLNKIKVVILGTDPYIYKNQAYGLAFSCNILPIPITLRNIFRELKYDLNINNNTGNLLNWAKQGVFLLNTILTVREGNSNSHNKLNWEIFTNNIISLINNNRRHIVYILWGNHAIKKKELIDSNKNKIIISSHPRPLSAMKTKYPFNGSKPFSKTNNYLIHNNISPINWQL
jgi:uracil-DNA glycosylase